MIIFKINKAKGWIGEILGKGSGFHRWSSQRNTPEEVIATEPLLKRQSEDVKI